MSTTAATPINRIDRLATLERVLEQSARRPQLVFKHSLTCPISTRAWGELQRHLSARGEGADYWLVTVQTDRSVSDSLEERLAVRHESPQAILIRDGRAVWSASHHRISRDALDDAVAASG